MRERFGQGESNTLDATDLTRMKHLVGLDTAPVVPARKHADINIFTVASGLLYEVRTALPCRDACLRIRIALCIHHDPQRHEAYPKLGQVLVH